MALEKSKNPVEFADFEKTGWQKQIAGYDHGVGAVSRQTVQPMLDAAKVRAGVRVLDVCCGPGMLADAAVKRGAKAFGLDFPDVVKLARTLAPAAEFQSGDAQNLPFRTIPSTRWSAATASCMCRTRKKRCASFTACCVLAAASP